MLMGAATLDPPGRTVTPRGADTADVNRYNGDDSTLDRTPAERAADLEIAIESLIVQYLALSSDERQTLFTKGDIARDILRRDKERPGSLDEFLSRTGEARKTVTNHAHIAGLFDNETDRAIPLTWTHFRQAAGADQPRVWLLRAAAGKWTCRQLQDEIDKANARKKVQKGVLCYCGCGEVLSDEGSAHVMFRGKRHSFATLLCMCNYYQIVITSNVDPNALGGDPEPTKDPDDIEARLTEIEDAQLAAREKALDESITAEIAAENRAAAESVAEALTEALPDGFSPLPAAPVTDAFREAAEVEAAPVDLDAEDPASLSPAAKAWQTLRGKKRDAAVNGTSGTNGNGTAPDSAGDEDDHGMYVLPPRVDTALVKETQAAPVLTGVPDPFGDED